MLKYQVAEATSSWDILDFALQILRKIIDKSRRIHIATSFYY